MPEKYKINTKEKFGYFSIYSIILAACIYGLYYIITKITKLRKEDGKKNAGKIFGLVIFKYLCVFIYTYNKYLYKIYYLNIK